MEHQQQNWATKSQPSTSVRSNQPQPRQPDLRQSNSRQPNLRQPSTVGLARFTRSRPLMILGGAWLLVVVVAMVALSGLLNPSLSKLNGNKSSEAAIATNTTETVRTAKRQGSIPLWLFGAIALSCTAGSILITKQASRPSRPRKSGKPKRLKPYAPTEAPFPPAPQPSAAETSPSPPIPQTYAQASRATSAPPYSPSLMPLTHSNAQSIVKPTPAVPVAVVPSEESHPLDWGEASLADKLDIRKQRSIASWLEQP